MNLFRKEPTVKFTCRIPGVAETYPIIKARDLKHDWVIKTTEEYRKVKNQDPSPNIRSTIVRCPGIRTIMQTGWIVSTWQDLYIESTDEGCIWRSATDQSLVDHAKQPFVDFHDSNTFMHNEALKNKLPIIKLQLPWTAILPRGYSMLQMGIPYQDQKFFSVAPGIFSWEFGNYPLNMQLLWEEKGKFLLPAGTPIAQLILVKDMKPKAEIRQQTEVEREWDLACTNAKHCEFNRSYGNLKRIMKSISSGYGVWK